MQNQRRMIMAQRYIARFVQILDEMANKMLFQSFTNSITVNFIKCMVPHHQAAIYMCENLLNYTTYEPLQRIAKDIIQMQTSGIEQMKKIENTTYGFYNSTRDVKNYTDKYLKITNEMIEKMKNSPRCVSINLDFVNEMIPHHEGAISMCENLLQYYIDPRLQQVANTIIREQSEGVRQLKYVQQRLCSKM